MVPRQGTQITPQRPNDFGLFWSLLGKLVARHMQQRAHAEITLVMQDGNLRQVRVNRSYLPTELPET